MNYQDDQAIIIDLHHQMMKTNLNLMTNFTIMEGEHFVS
jgi:hypothetical protein